MQEPDYPAEEGQRLHALLETGLLDTPPEERFDRLTRLARHIAGVKTALVSLVDHDRQWFKSRQGLDATETGRNISFCGHAIHSDEPLIIEDTLADARFADNPLVKAAPAIRFYAGFPLHSSEGWRLGTLCVIDDQPGTLHEPAQRALRDLADAVEREMRVDDTLVKRRTISRITRVLASSDTSVESLMTRLLEIGCDYFGADFGLLLQADGALVSVSGAAHSGGEVEEWLGSKMEGLFAPSRDRMHPLVVEDLRETWHDQAADLPIRGCVGLSIPGKGQRLGSLGLLFREPLKVHFLSRHRREVLQLIGGALEAYLRIQVLAEENSASEQKLRELLRQVPGAVFQFQLWPDGRTAFPYASPGIRSIYESEPEDLMTDASRAFEKLHPEDYQGVWDSIVESAESLKPWRHEYRVCLDTGIKWLEGHSVPTAQADGSILWHGHIRDITEQKRLERIKEEFVGTISHELRTPLTAAQGALGLLRSRYSGQLPEKAGELLDMAERNSRRLLRLINQLLDVNRIESGRLSVALQPVSLKQATLSACRDICHYGSKANIGVEPVDRGLEEDTKVLADPERLQQVLDNLLSNAIKFSSPDSRVEVRTGRDASHAWVEVEDWGQGIPAAFQNQLFQRFAQADASDRRTSQGAGLGLAITRELVEAMKGEIGFSSRQGEGSCFWIRFPVFVDGTAT